MADSVLEQLGRRVLDQADREENFAGQKFECHTAEIFADNTATYQIIGCDESDQLPPQHSRKSEKTLDRRDSISDNLERNGLLRCIVQRSRPRHVSGRPDALPFRNAHTMQRIFQQLDLPLAYFQICDGHMTTVFSYVNRDNNGRPSTYEFAIHCIAKQGDWALALTHTAMSWSISAYLSIDERMNSTDILRDMHDFRLAAGHAMLLPCIMFATTLKLAIERRRSLKERLQYLEDSIKKIDRKGTIHLDLDFSTEEYETTQQNIETLFKVLESCRKDQESRKGLYRFWNGFKTAIDNGLQYTEEILSSASDDHRFRTHQELKIWATVTWERLQSLKARDKDHIIRVDNTSFMLHKIIQQRDMRLQSGIAKASQRDSEDMKFIAVLGSVFLPAGLVASILNVQAWQFLPGPELFGVYIAITIPLIALVVVICFSRPYWKRVPLKFLRPEKEKPLTRQPSMFSKRETF